jgi:hypothetical protein
VRNGRLINQTQPDLKSYFARDFDHNHHGCGRESKKARPKGRALK